MFWGRMLPIVVMGGTLVAAGLLHVGGAAGPIGLVAQSSSPTYAIPLKDGSSAVVWWDTVSDPARPAWRCEMRSLWGEGSSRTIITLQAGAGDWRAALAEAREFLKGRAAENE